VKEWLRKETKKTPVSNHQGNLHQRKLTPERALFAFSARLSRVICRPGDILTLIGSFMNAWLPSSFHSQLLSVLCPISLPNLLVFIVRISSRAPCHLYCDVCVSSSASSCLRLVYFLLFTFRRRKVTAKGGLEQVVY
jgi:hypothetical protein